MGSEGYKRHYRILKERLVPLIKDISEQKKIAAILSSVDEVIEDIQKKIKKLQDLKKATMNELLTKGIGHKRFKDSELGSIPKDWNKSELGKHINTIAEGGTPSTKNREYYNGNISWVVIDDIKPKIFNTQTKISQKGLEQSSAKVWERGTIILSTGATIGRVGIAMKRMATKQGICGIIPKRTLDGSYLYQYFLFIAAKLISLAQGSTIKETRAPLIKKIIIAFPPLPEQKKIAAILSSVDGLIEDAQRKYDKYQSLKKSLMQDLLAGRVRVQVD